MTEAVPIRVPVGFEQEFPGASRSAAEAAATLVRTADALLREFDRRRRTLADLSPSGFQALAILDGAGEPLAGHVVAERLLVSSSSMTSLFDTLQRRGFVERRPHPVDRRKVLIHLTDAGRGLVDPMLPVVHATSTEAFSVLTEGDREQLIKLLSAVHSRLADLATSTPPSPKPRHRPARSG